MIVLKILFLFLPLLLLAEANFGTGPFHRSPPATIPSGSPAISTNLPGNQRIPSPPKLPHLDEKLSVHAEPVTLVAKETSVAVETATLLLKIDTDPTIETETSESAVIQKPHPLNSENVNQDTSPYHDPKPMSPWNPPKFLSPSVNVQKASQPNTPLLVQVESVTPVTTEKNISVDPAILPPKIDTDSPIEIQTTIPPEVQKPHPYHTENINQDTSSNYVSKPASSPWNPQKFPTPSLNIHTVSQSNIVKSVHDEPVTVVTTAKSVSVEPATLPPKIYTDSPIQIQTTKPGLVQPPNYFHIDDINQNTSPFHVPKPMRPWSPPKFPRPSVNMQKESQPNNPLLVQVEPVTPVTTEKIVSVHSAILPPKIDTDSPIEIQTRIPPEVQKPHPYHTENITQDTSSNYVSKPASSPWNPQKFPTPSLNIHTVSQPNIVKSVHDEPVTVVTPAKSVPVEPATLPPKIDTDSPIEIQTTKPGLVQPPNYFHNDNINQNTSPFHVPKPMSPWSPPKFPSPSINMQKASQPNTPLLVQVEPVTLVTTEKNISVDPAIFPPKIDTNSPIEIQTPIPPEVQKPHPFHTVNINQDTSTYHVSKPASSPWSPPKFPRPSVNMQKASQPNTPLLVQVEPVTPVTKEKIVSVHPAILPPKIDTDSPIEIQTPIPPEVQKPHSFHTKNINQHTSTYHVSKPASSPWSPAKFPTASLNIHTVTQPNTVKSVHDEPVTVVTPAKSVSVEPATLPPKIDTDSPIEIKTTKPGLVQQPNYFHNDHINQNTSPFHVPKLMSPWSPPKFPRPSVNMQKASQPNTPLLVQVEPVTPVTTEKNVSVHPAILPPKIDTDSPIAIQTPIPPEVQKPHSYHKGNINQDISAHHISKPASSPWIPSKFPTPSLNTHRASQPHTPTSVNVRPVTADTIKKSVSVDPGSAPPKIYTDSRREQTSKPALVQSLYPSYTDNGQRNTSPYHVFKPSSSPWKPSKFSAIPSIDIRIAPQFNTGSPVHVETVTPVPIEKSVSVDSVTLPPKIDTDSPVDIQPQKPTPAPSTHPFHNDIIHRDNISSFHVPSPVSNPWIPPKFPTIPSIYNRRASQPNSPPLVNLQLVNPIPTENSVSEEPATFLHTIEMDSPIEIQTSKPGLLQAPHPFHTDNLHGDSVSAYRAPNSLHPEHSSFISRPAPSPRFPNKDYTNSSKEILSASQPVHIDKINHKEIGPYHRSQRSAGTRDQHTRGSLEEDHISQNNVPPPALTTERRFMCPQAYGYFKHTNQCGEYIECKNYIPLAYTCPVGLYFNPLAKWTEYPCDHPSNVQCDEETIPLPTIISSSPANTPTPNVLVATTPRPYNQKHGFTCSQPHGYFKISGRCEQYIECKNYVALMFSCPVGLHFNPRVEWTEYPCEDPYIVQCDSESSDEKPLRPTEAPTTTTAPPPPTARPLPPPTTRPPPPPTTRPPPPPTTRSPPPPPTTRQPPSAPTTRRPPPPPTTRPPNPHPTTTLPVITRGPKNPPNYNICLLQFGYFKFSDQCDEYIECKNYVPLIFTCPVGLHFNPLADWTEYPCDHPSKVQCIEESINPKVPSTMQPLPVTTTQSSVVTTPQPGSKSLDFKCPEANGYFKYNDQCSEYIECKNHVPLAYTCPSELYFNAFVHWTEYPCDHPSKVQCNKESGTKQPTENPNVTSRPVVPPQPTIATPKPTIATPKPIIATPKPTIATPKPTIATPEPTAVTPYIPRFPTQGTVRPSNEQPSFELIDYYCHDPNAYYSVTSQCDAYVECQGFKAIYRYCPAGLQFDSKAQWPKLPCDYPSIVQCDTGAGTKQPTEYPNLTPRPTEGIKQPLVVTSRPTIATPRSTVVTPSLPHFPTQRTMYPPSSPPPPPPPTIVTQSPTKVTPYIPRFPTQRPPTERPSLELIDYYCQEPNGYYAVASQCDTYIECKSNNAIQLFCPTGLHFNPKAQWPNDPCDYPSRVQCKNESVNDDPIARPDNGIHRPNIGLLRPTIRTPRPNIVPLRRPTRTDITRIAKQPIVKPSRSTQPSNYSCPESNGFHPVASQCDVYVECKNGTATEHTCPDGLLFNTNAHWSDYPCGYPSEVTCSSGDVVQQPNPAAECPHREGFFPSPTAHGDCGEYIVCHAGVATIKHCPPGLVFNFDKLNTCDWPVNVPACNQARALEGFVCPAPPVNENALHVHKYRYGRSCKNFIACQKGHPRLLACDAELRFNEETESCVDSDLVEDCDA